MRDAEPRGGTPPRIQWKLGRSRGRGRGPKGECSYSRETPDRAVGGNA